MKKLLLLLAFPILGVSAQIEGTWKLAPQAGSLAVGPALNNLTWFSSSLGDVTTRACLFDDSIKFAPGGAMTHYMDGSTWLEGWQGAPEGCGTPVAPHTGGAATYAFDAALGTLTVNGLGAHMGLAKVHNAGELTSPAGAVSTITYNVLFSNGGNTMTAQINFGGGWWQYVYQKTELITPAIEGTWKLAGQAGALAVGPALNNLTWFASSLGDVTTRACLFDDSIKFAPGGAMTHYMGGSTWLEGWQGAPEGCGTPVAPHTGGAATYAFDAALGTLTVNGLGAHIGLAKVHNAGELTSPAGAVSTITYNVAFSNGGNTMTAQINFGGGWWQYVYQKMVVINPPTPTNVFDDIIAVSPNHTYLEAALIQAGLDVALQNPASSLTVFAPDDAAITALVTALGTTISGLLANPLLSDILLYHVVGSQVLSTALVNGPVVTLNGASVIIDLTSGVMVNTATVTTADLLADNGVVHVINSVLVPPNLNISEFSISDLQLYPNPSIDVIKITNSVVENYSILSSNGVIVSSGKVINNEISVSHLDAGIYFLNLTVKGESQTIRIIKN
jgi:uncharacterized surface protein with fasciclin (FAS1) repeats